MQKPKKPDDMLVPYVIFTFAFADGERGVLAIEDDLDELPSPLWEEAALYMPRTPDKVRTMCYNQVAQHVAPKKHQQPPTPAIMAERVLLHTLPNGDPLLEVQLTREGLEFLEWYHSDSGFGFHHSFDFFYSEYDRRSQGGRFLFDEHFEARLKAAIRHIGLAP